jgi:hypothetical protein
VVQACISTIICACFGNWLCFCLQVKGEGKRGTPTLLGSFVELASITGPGPVIEASCI